MSARPELLEVAGQWVTRAESDLINARHTLTLREGCPYETVCFHAQQRAEKYLKANLPSAGSPGAGASPHGDRKHLHLPVPDLVVLGE